MNIIPNRIRRLLTPPPTPARPAPCTCGNSWCTYKPNQPQRPWWKP